MKLKLSFIIIALFGNLANAQFESGGFADTSNIYVCKDLQNEYLVTLNKLGPVLRTLSVTKDGETVLVSTVTKNNSIRCFAPCDIFENPIENISFGVTTIRDKITGLLSSTNLNLELNCKKNIIRKIECDSRRKESQCNK